MLYVVDAHSLVWFLKRHRNTSDTARRVLSDPSSRLVIPTICLAEISHLSARTPWAITMDAVRHFRELSTNIVIRAFDEAILDLFPAGFEIHDSIIVATALYYRDVMHEPCTVLTHDHAITASRLVDVTW